jgi:protein-disulfide isomerase
MGKKKTKNSSKETTQQSSSVKIYAGAGLLLVVIAVAVVAWVMSQRADTVESVDSARQATVERTDVNLKGNPEAVNKLTKYSDFGCIHCANLHVHLTRFIEEHGDDFNLEIMYFPINNNIPSRMAASAAISSGRQGKYWEMVDLLYRNANDWRSDPETTFLRFVDELELDREQFFRDMNDEDIAYQVVKDYFSYQELGINSTPTLFLNGERIPNPRTYDQLVQSLTQ